MLGPFPSLDSLRNETRKVAIQTSAQTLDAAQGLLVQYVGIQVVREKQTSRFLTEPLTLTALLPRQSAPTTTLD